MSYVLVNRFDEIIHSCNMNNLKEAKVYFMGTKKLQDEEKFDNLWKVMSREEYDNKLKDSVTKPSSEGYQWWQEDKTETDESLSGKDGLG